MGQTENPSRSAFMGFSPSPGRDALSCERSCYPIVPEKAAQADSMVIINIVSITPGSFFPIIPFTPSSLQILCILIIIQTDSRDSERSPFPHGIPEAPEVSASSILITIRPELSAVISPKFS